MRRLSRTIKALLAALALTALGVLMIFVGAGIREESVLFLHSFEGARWQLGGGILIVAAVGLVVYGVVTDGD